MKKVLFLLSVLAVFGTLVINGGDYDVQSASVPNYLFTTNRTYTVAKGGNSADVEINTTVLYRKAPGFFLPSPTASFSISLADPKSPESELEQQRQSLKVTDAKGRALSFTATKRGRAYQVVVTYPDAVSSGQSYTVIARYKNTEAAYRLGGTVHVSVGGYTKDTQFSGSQGNNTYQIQEKVIVRGSKGDIGKDLVTVLYPEPQKASVSGDTQSYEWSAQSLLGQSVGIVAGREQIFRFEFKNKAVATQQQETLSSKLLKNTYKISVPYDIPEVGQTVVFDYIDPLPDAVEFSTVGSWQVPYFVYYVSPTEEKDILISGYIKTTKPYTTAQLAASKISQIPPALKDQYTKAEQYWEVQDSQVQLAALELKNKAKADSLLELVRADYKYVVDLLTYDEAKVATRESNVRLGATQTLIKKSGVCMEFADLLVALLRAQGIPAMAANGAGYSRYDKPESFIGHQWVMVYFPTVGWVPVDPTWGDTGGDLIGVDLLHAYFGLMPDGQSRDSFLVSYLGWDQGFALSLPSVFVHTTESLPTSGLAAQTQQGASLQDRFRIFSPDGVAQRSTQSEVFAGYPYQTVADVQKVVQERQSQAGLTEKVQNQLVKLQSSAWGKILIDRAPIIAVGIVVLVLIIIVFQFMRRRTMQL